MTYAPPGTIEAALLSTAVRWVAKPFHLTAQSEKFSPGTTKWFPVTFLAYYMLKMAPPWPFWLSRECPRRISAQADHQWNAYRKCVMH